MTPDPLLAARRQVRQRKAIEALADRSYKSYRARLNAEKRLKRVGQSWNATQFCLSTALVSSSIVFLAFPEKHTPLAATLLVILAILALVVSLVVTFLDYSARAKAMFANYRALQAFSVRLETLSRSKFPITTRQLDELQKEYNSLLDTSENHSPLDHFRTIQPDNANSPSVLALASMAAPYILPTLLTFSAVVALAVSILAAL